MGPLPRRSASLSDTGRRASLLLAAPVLAGAGLGAGQPALSWWRCGAAQGAAQANGRHSAAAKAATMRQRLCCSAKLLADGVVVSRRLADAQRREIITALPCRGHPDAAQPRWVSGKASNRLTPAVITKDRPSQHQEVSITSACTPHGQLPCTLDSSVWIYAHGHAQLCTWRSHRPVCGASGLATLWQRVKRTGGRRALYLAAGKASR